MSETVVNVTTLEQWKSVLYFWFKQGYSWYSGDQKYHGEYFNNGIRELLLNKDHDILVPTPGTREPISYQEFMAQQQDDNKIATYYVTQEQLDFLNEIYEQSYSLDELLNKSTEAKKLFDDYNIPAGNTILLYLGGDETIELKVKETLYRLWRIDGSDNMVYMQINGLGTPILTTHKHEAFTAPLDEIEKWKTPAWDIEEAD